MRKNLWSRFQTFTSSLTVLAAAGLVLIALFAFLTPDVEAREIRFDWAAGAGGPSVDAGYGIAVDSGANSYVAGRIYDTAAFGATNLTSAGSADVFVAKLTELGVPDSQLLYWNGSQFGPIPGGLDTTRNLYVIVHGWMIPAIGYTDMNEGTWMADMATAITGAVPPATANVFARDWLENATDVPQPTDKTTGEAKLLFKALRANGLDSAAEINLMGHSLGASVATRATTWLRVAPPYYSSRINLSLFDPPENWGAGATELFGILPDGWTSGGPVELFGPVRFLSSTYPNTFITNYLTQFAKAYDGATNIDLRDAVDQPSVQGRLPGTGALADHSFSHDWFFNTIDPNYTVLPFIFDPMRRYYPYLDTPAELWAGWGAVGFGFADIALSREPRMPLIVSGRSGHLVILLRRSNCIASSFRV